MKKTLVTALTLWAAGFSISAAAAPETYQLDLSHTAPYFEYNHHGYSRQMHRFDKTTGTITLDRAAKTGSVDVVIDTKSVNTGYAKFNEHIQSEDFFDTAKYPTITFKSTAMKFAGDQPASVEGQLTIKGITKPVTLTVTGFAAKPHPMLRKDAIGGNATAQIKRSDFNMGKYAPYVSDEVTLNIAIEAIQQ
jgi:polyisoprenoid-binding protein YceI